MGHIGEVEKAYRRLLKVQPDHPDALHLLGVISHQFGRNLDAVELINRAIEVNQRQPAYLSNLGEAHRALGQLSEAIQSDRPYRELWIVCGQQRLRDVRPPYQPER